MNIYEVIDEWGKKHPYRRFDEDEKFSNSVRYISDKQLQDIASHMFFLEDADESFISILLINISLYYYSQRSAGNYAKVKRPDHVVQQISGRVDAIIRDLEGCKIFSDDIEALQALKKKLGQKFFLRIHNCIYPQKPMSKQVIRNLIEMGTKALRLNGKSGDIKALIDII